MTRRLPHPAEGYRIGDAAQRSRAGIRKRLVADRIQTFSTLVAVVGGIVVVAACFLPFVTEPDGYSFSFISAKWFAIVPFAVAAAIASTAVLLSLRPLARPVTSGLFAGVGIGGLAYFVGYFGWTAELRLKGYGQAGSPGIATYLGTVGAGLVLVAAAPGTALDILANLVGAGRALGHSARTLPTAVLPSEASARRRPERVRALAACYAIGGAALVIAACFVRYSPNAYSLYGHSISRALQPLLPAVAGGLAGLFLLLSSSARRLTAALLLGVGLSCLAFFVGLLGSAEYLWNEPVSVGMFLGLAGGGVLLVAGAAALWASRAEPG